MKSNAKYTALEILNECKIVDAESVFGKFRVTIGGIAGIVKPNHLIKIASGTKELEVIVGIEKFSLEIKEEAEDIEISESAQSTLEKEGLETSKKAEEIAEAKKEVSESIEE